MAAAFDPQEFIARLSRRLVAEFDDASQAGTPGLIGSAREHPAREQVERLLPGAAGVGTGLVIDTYGGVSRQQDVIVYEKAFCPIFSINNAPEATYYPCEGTIAVGEIKSRMGSKELEDAFGKISSVKRLRRCAVATEGGLAQGKVVPFRHYGSSTSFEGTKDEEFSQRTRACRQLSQNSTQTSATAARKVLASLSYRVEMAR